MSNKPIASHFDKQISSYCSYLSKVYIFFIAIHETWEVLARRINRNQESANVVHIKRASVFELPGFKSCGLSRLFGIKLDSDQN